MKSYWQDIQDDNDQWSHLQLEVEGGFKPSLRLEAGGNSRFKASCGTHTLFWGNAQQGHYGAWILRNDNAWTKEAMPIPPITSGDIEASKRFSREEQPGFWAKYFAKGLNQSSCSPLYAGKWMLTDKHLKLETSDIYLPVDAVKPENRVSFYAQRPLFLDWGFHGSHVPIALKALPDENEGRVKWWRKQVRQNTCPPALIWFVSCLQAYVVLDGHARLRAFQLEGKSPQFMVLKSVIEQSHTVDMARAKAVYENLQKSKEHPWKKPPTLDEVNQLLISVYDDRPFQSYISHSLGKADMEQQWLREVEAFKDHMEVDNNELASMLQGQ